MMRDTLGAEPGYLGGCMGSFWVWTVGPSEPSGNCSLSTYSLLCCIGSFGIFAGILIESESRNVWFFLS